jgi:ABC-type dipeptide/oligopeptide/nickel transport system permease component
VVTVIAEQLPSTIELATAAMIIAASLGIVLGTAAAFRPRTWLDAFIMTLSVTGVSVPIFGSALLLIGFFSLHLGWLPATGQGSLGQLVMPATVLGFASSGAIARLVRASLLEVLNRDYVTTARAKGLAPRSVLLRHALRNALVPVITIMGLQFSFLLGGTVVTETVFSRPGIGRLIVDAILWKDFPVVQGAVLLAALVYTLVNLAVDLAYLYLDPRIRYD